ncbi:MAG: AMP-binding protein [Ectothiorhodospiraceae bacterium]|nr:AMP-binding protein [Ectothiorhodospiraceae bacterium]
MVGRRTIRDLLEHRARSDPSREFLVFDDLAGGVLRIDYAGLDRLTNRAADLLTRLGVEPGEAINLHLPNCPEFLILWLGAAKLGVVTMPTNVASPAAELEYLVQHSESRLIFTTPPLAEVAETVRARCPLVRQVVKVDADVRGLEALLADTRDVAPVARPASEDVAGILYTSGTTSRPKGVLVTHANYLYAGETVAKGLALRSDDRFLTALPLFHGNAQYYSTMGALVAGATVVLMPRFSASRYLDVGIRHRCTVASLFAAPMRMLLAQPVDPRHRSNRLRVVMFAQSISEAQVAEWSSRFGAPLLQIWGMTETMGPPLMNPLAGPRDPMSIGLPSLGYRVALVGDDGRPTPPGDIGQIVVEGTPGQTLMLGYFKNPEATDETLRDGWLWTGDNARQDADGRFHFVDRLKDMIKRAGENVAAGEVEAVLGAHPDVFDCAVVGVPDAMRDEAIVAFVVPHAGATPSAATLIEWCRERLATFRVPSRIELRDTLPRTSVGKIQKHILRAEARAGTPGVGPT